MTAPVTPDCPLGVVADDPNVYQAHTEREDRQRRDARWDEGLRDIEREDAEQAEAAASAGEVGGPGAQVEAGEESDTGEAPAPDEGPGFIQGAGRLGKSGG